MKKFLFIVLVLVNLVHAEDNSYAELEKHDIQAALKVAQKNIKTYTGESLLLEHENLGHIYTLLGKPKLAEKEYKIAINNGLEFFYFGVDYEELAKIYPEKKKELNNGKKLLEKFIDPKFFNPKKYVEIPMYATRKWAERNDLVHVARANRVLGMRREVLFSQKTSYDKDYDLVGGVRLNGYMSQEKAKKVKRLVFKKYKLINKKHNIVVSSAKSKKQNIEKAYKAGTLTASAYYSALDRGFHSTKTITDIYNLKDGKDTIKLTIEQNKVNNKLQSDVTVLLEYLTHDYIETTRLRKEGERKRKEDSEKKEESVL